MKKINCLFLLFFAYFICIVSVFACNTYFDEDNNTYTTWACEFAPVAIRDYIHTKGVSSTTDHDFLEMSQLLSDNMEYVTNYNLFGNYSDNSLIHYFKPSSAYSSFNALYYSYNAQVGANPNGEAWWSKTYEATQYVDIDFGPNVTTRTLNRIDFSIHINFNSIPEQVKKNIFGGLLVSPTLASGSNGQSYCASTYSYANERINVSCSFNYDGSNLIVRILNNNPLDFNYSANNYTYFAYFDVSDYTLVASLDSFSSSSVDDLDTDKSPNGSQFNDYYNVIQTHSSYFNSVPFENYNGLTQVVASPLRLINNLSAETKVPLEFSLFKKTIEIPNGCELFWCKTNRDFTTKDIAGIRFTRSEQYFIYNAFRIFWRSFFGGFLLYLSLRKAFKVTANLVNPNNTSVEVF